MNGGNYKLLFFNLIVKFTNKDNLHWIIIQRLFIQDTTNEQFITKILGQVFLHFTQKTLTLICRRTFGS